MGDAASTTAHPKDKGTAFLFGDAVSCTALEYCTESSEDETPPAFFVLKSKGSGWSNIIIESSGLHKHKAFHKDEAVSRGEDGFISINGPAVFNFALQEVPELIEELLDLAHLSMDAVDAICLHQANGFINNYLVRKLGVTGRAPSNIDRFGNTSNASIPLLIADFPEQCLAKNVLCCAFGVGFSMAACLVNLKNTKTSLDVWHD